MLHRTIVGSILFFMNIVQLCNCIFYNSDDSISLDLSRYSEMYARLEFNGESYRIKSCEPDYPDGSLRSAYICEHDIG